MDLESKIADRELSEFPISIGSGLAILLLMDANTESPSVDRAKDKPEELWINLSTLLRNLSDSVVKDLRDKLTPDIAVNLLLKEISAIAEEMRIRFEDKMKIIFYQSHYRYLNAKFMLASLKDVKAGTQQHSFKKLEYAVLDKLKKPLQKLIKDELTIADKTNVEYKVIDDFPTCEFKHLWVITHYPVDLLGFKRARKILLLESHTARLLLRSEWNRKFSTKLEVVSNIPFNKLTLQIFGDGGNHFSVMPNSFKKSILELASSKKWSSSTPDTVVTIHLTSMSDVYTGTIFKKMLK